MTYQSKRELRRKIHHLEADLEERREADREANQAARDAIRVLSLTEYIEERESAWSTHLETHYDVDQFLTDIKIAAKALDSREAAREEGEALERLRAGRASGEAQETKEKK